MQLHKQRIADFAAERARRMQAVTAKTEEAEKKKQERALREAEEQRLTAEQAKKEYYAQLALEVMQCAL
jgi:hypothetical protein